MIYERPLAQNLLCHSKVPIVEYCRPKIISLTRGLHVNHSTIEAINLNVIQTDDVWSFIFHLLSTLVWHGPTARTPWNFSICLSLGRNLIVCTATVKLYHTYIVLSYII